MKTRAPAAPVTLVPGEEICDESTGDRYRILSLLAEGGMGRVFRAEKVGTGDVYAVKCHRPIDPDHVALKVRLENEGVFLKKLGQAPHICPVLATGMRRDGLSWIVMPLLNGASVGQLLDVLPRVPLVWTLEVIRAVCIALAHAHRNAIHRDIKPENIFVTRSGEVFVLDWGAGKFYACGRLTTTGTTIGTIAFMSPEQLTDPDHITGLTDLFSTGVTFFLMLAGKHPFDPEGPLQGNAFAIAHRILEEPPRRLPEGLPTYVEEVVLKFLQKNPHHRHRDAVEAAEVVDAALNKMRAEIGETSPLAWLFSAYDRAQGAVVTAELNGGPSDPAMASGPRVKLGTVPLGPAPEAFARGPEGGRARAGGTIRMGAAGGQVQARGSTVPIVRHAASEPPPSAPLAPDAPAAPQGPEAPLPRKRPGAVPLQRVSDEDRTARMLQILEGLGAHDHPEARKTLLAVLSTYEDAPILRAAAATSLARIGDEGCIEALEIRTAYDLHPMVRRVAEDARAAILDRLGDPDRPRMFAPMDPPAFLPDPEPREAKREEAAGGDSVPVGEESEAEEAAGDEEVELFAGRTGPFFRLARVVAAPPTWRHRLLAMAIIVVLGGILGLLISAVLHLFGFYSLFFLK